jgi:membrane protease YdiL (CAAX protease family)
MTTEDTDAPLSAVGDAAGLGVAGLFAGLVLGFVSFLALGTVLTVRQGSALSNAVALFAQGAGLLAVGVAYLSIRDLPLSSLRVRWPSLRDLGWAVAALVALFAVLGGLSAIIRYVGLSAAEHSVAQAAENNPEMLLPLIPLQVLVVGPTEEFLYRGVIQTRLREAFDTYSVVLLAALIFSLVHVPAYAIGSGFDLSLATTLGVLFVLGTVLGAVYEYTENLLVPVVAHGIYNAVVFGSLYAEYVGPY